MVDEHEIEIEYFYIVNSRFGVFLKVRAIFLEPDASPSTSGIGDFEIGLQWIGFNGHNDILWFGLNVVTPTGDADRDLGAGHATLELVTYYWHTFGCGIFYQGEFRLEALVSVDDPENEFVFNMGVSKTLASTCDARIFRYLTPTFEVNGVTEINGDDSGSTVINLTPGLRWLVRDDDQVGCGFSFPITGTEAYRGQFILDYILHY